MHVRPGRLAMLECRFNKTTHPPKVGWLTLSILSDVQSTIGPKVYPKVVFMVKAPLNRREEEEEEEFITSGNCRGKHSSLSRVAGAGRVDGLASGQSDPARVPEARIGLI